MMKRGEDVPAHLEHQHGQRQHKADLEPPGHVDQLWAGTAVETDFRRLKRHAADRASPRVVLPNLGMHRTGPNCARRCIDGFGRGQVALRIGDKFCSAFVAAEVPLVADMARMMRRSCRIDLHSADWVGDEDSVIVVVTMRLGMRVGVGHRQFPEAARRHGRSEGQLGHMRIECTARVMVKVEA